MTVYADLPVWSDEWMFGIKTAEVTSVQMRNGEEIVFVKIPGRVRRSKFKREDVVIRCPLSVVKPG